jgi:hypothetical protein
VPLFLICVLHLGGILEAGASEPEAEDGIVGQQEGGKSRHCRGSRDCETRGE